MNPDHNLSQELQSYAVANPTQQNNGGFPVNDLMSLLHILGISSGQPQSGLQSGFSPSDTYDPTGLKSYAQQAVVQAFPNDPNAWGAFDSIVNKESGWNPTAANKTSSARGLMQFLSSTAPSYGLPSDASTASPEDQINAGIKYIQSRYGTPSQAWNFHTTNNWY